MHYHILDVHKINGLKLLRNDEELYRTFIKWLVYSDVNIEQKEIIELHLKKFTLRVKEFYTTDSIIAAAEHAILENHKTIYPKEKMPNHENRERLSDYL
tara:strand:+ start:86 stop:382 length:297 start_codon:yes stop_codon:yes gene_type:complete